jgi:tRNA threonylcarbamoyladenosine biosynthesis protein TsaB
MVKVAALAIETSSASGSVAVGRGSVMLGARRFTQLRAHAAEFLPSIESLCREHDIAPDEIAHVFVSAGPGSFTGLRIGVTAVRTLALAVGARVVALPTLEVIAQNALESAGPPPQVCVILDAKRSRVYTAAFALSEPPTTEREDSESRLHRAAPLGGWAVDRRRYVAIDSPREADPVDYLAGLPRDCAVLGEGVLYHRVAVDKSGLAVLAEEMFAPRVETVYGLGAERAAQGLFVPPRDLIPVYIRPPEAEEVWAARQGRKSEPRP